MILNISILPNEEVPDIQPQDDPKPQPEDGHLLVGANDHLYRYSGKSCAYIPLPPGTILINGKVFAPITSWDEDNGSE